MRGLTFKEKVQSWPRRTEYCRTQSLQVTKTFEKGSQSMGHPADPSLCSTLLHSRPIGSHLEQQAVTTTTTTQKKKHIMNTRDHSLILRDRLHPCKQPSHMLSLPWLRVWSVMSQTQCGCSPLTSTPMPGELAAQQSYSDQPAFELCCATREPDKPA